MSSSFLDGPGEVGIERGDPRLCGVREVGSLGHPLHCGRECQFHRSRWVWVLCPSPRATKGLIVFGERVVVWGISLLSQAQKLSSYLFIGELASLEDWEIP